MHGWSFLARWGWRLPAIVVAAGLGLALLAACSDAPVPEPDGDSLEPPAVAGKVMAGGTLRSADGRLDVTVPGDQAIMLTIVEQRDAPPPPPGWRFLIPVYEIKAEDAGGSLSVLPAPFGLRFFAAAPGVLATIIVYDGSRWQLVASERDPTGNLTATIDHLTPYTVAAPIDPRATPTPVPTITKPTPRLQPTLTPTPGDNENSILVNTPTPTPRPPTPTPTPIPRPGTPTVIPAISSGQARIAAERELEKYKGRKVAVAAAPFDGRLMFPAGPAIEDLFRTPNAAWGTYGGLSEILTTVVNARDVAGTLTLLVEPQTGLPADDEAAAAALDVLFPGAPGTWKPVLSASDGYAYSANLASGAVALRGYAEVEGGLVFAYLLTGTGQAGGVVANAAKAAP